jgi:DNA-binding NtrC family response regulator
MSLRQADTNRLSADPAPFCDQDMPVTVELSRTVLVVDDEESIRTWLARSLDEFGCEVLKAPDTATARAILQSSKVNALILDVRLARESGLDVLEYVRGQERLAELPVIVLTGSDLSSKEQDLIRRHRAHLFYKPQGIESIADALDRLLGRGVATAESREASSPATGALQG